MSERLVYLMRGLPSCGKSHTALELAGESGVICETDQYFYSEVGDDPQQYNYDTSLLAAARSWNVARFRQALEQQRSPVVVDRGNGRNAESFEYIQIAREFGYAVEFCEPTSAWWRELRVLLKYRHYVAEELFEKWAESLAAKSRETHRVPASTILRWMKAWKSDLTVDQVESAFRPADDAEGHEVGS